MGEGVDEVLLPGVAGPGLQWVIRLSSQANRLAKILNCQVVIFFPPMSYSHLLSPSAYFGRAVWPPNVIGSLKLFLFDGMIPLKETSVGFHHRNPSRPPKRPPAVEDATTTVQKVCPASELTT